MTEFEHQGRTDRLEAVLQAILDEQQTGILNLERGKGGVRESGSIILLYGQVFEASAGGRSGVEALKWLKTWGTCQYIFAPKAPSEIVALPPAPPTPPAASPAPNVTTTPLPLLAQSTTRGVGEPVLAEKPAKAVETRPSDTRRLQYTPPPAIPAASAPPATTYQTQGQNTGPIYQEQQNTGSLHRDSQLGAPQPVRSIQNYQPARATPIAYRLTQGPEALLFMERVGLTRLHRHVFLLLDGQRNTIDLVRLTRRPLDEIQHLLRDLERYGLIKQE